MSGGGSTSTNEFKPPAYTQQGWKDYLTQAQQLAGGGITPYQGQTVSPLSPQTGVGLQMLTDYATQGTPERAAGGQAIVRAATGQAANPYAGINPYLSQMIESSNAKIADAYRRGTGAQTDAMFGRGGAYGGSAWQDRVRQNEGDLQAALAQNTNALLGQNYTQSAQLAENALGRQLQAAQIGQGQQGLDASAIQQLLGGGQIQEQNYQKLLDANRDLYQQRQQAPFTLMDFLGSALSRASGTGGQQTYTTPGQSPITAGLGGLSLGAGLFGLG